MKMKVKKKLDSQTTWMQGHRVVTPEEQIKIPSAENHELAKKLTQNYVSEKEQLELFIGEFNTLTEEDNAIKAKISNVQDRMLKLKRSTYDTNIELARKYIEENITSVKYKFTKFDRARVKQLMKQLREHVNRYQTVQDRIEILQLVWELRAHFMQFPLLERIRDAIHELRPDWKLVLTEDPFDANLYQGIQINTNYYPFVEDVVAGDFDGYKVRQTLKCNGEIIAISSNYPVYPACVAGIHFHDEWAEILFTDAYKYSNKIIPDTIYQIFDYGHGRKASSFTSLLLHDPQIESFSSYGSRITDVNELRAPAMKMSPEFLVFDHMNTEISSRNLLEMLRRYCSLGESAAYYYINDRLLDPYTFNPIDENIIAKEYVKEVERRAAEVAKKKEKERIMALPQNNVEAIRLRYPFIKGARIVKVLTGNSNEDYFRVTLKKNVGMLCVQGKQDSWKLSFDKSYVFHNEHCLSEYFHTVREFPKEK